MIPPPRKGSPPEQDDQELRAALETHLNIVFAQVEEALGSKVRELGQRSEELVKSLAAFTEKNLQLKSQLEKCKTQIDRLEGQLTDKEDQNTGLRPQVEGCKAQIDRLPV